VLWPDEEVGTCTWYKAHVSECDVASGKGTIHYDETNETEECDLKELIQEGHIAFSECRAPLQEHAASRLPCRLPVWHSPASFITARCCYLFLQRSRGQ
jgi:hypothetical protein